MKKAMVSGTFDPFTLGHLDVVKRAARIFDVIYVAILINAAKKPIFTLEERKRQIEDALGACGIDNVKVISFGGLLVDCCREYGIDTIVRGIRNSFDVEYERALETVNKELLPDLDTVYFQASPQFIHISSSIVREIAGYGRSIRGMVPDVNIEAIEERMLRYERE